MVVLHNVLLDTKGNYFSADATWLKYESLLGSVTVVLIEVPALGGVLALQGDSLQNTGGF